MFLIYLKIISIYSFFKKIFNFIYLTNKSKNYVEKEISIYNMFISYIFIFNILLY